MKRFAISLALVLAVTSANASLSSVERERLAAGELLIERTTYDRAGGRHYVGGISYLIIDVPAKQLSAIVRDPKRYAELFPIVHKVETLRITPSGRATLRFTHKAGPFEARYTTHVEFEKGGMVGRFTLDRTADNDLEDAWGFVRLTPLGDGARTLVTYGILFDLGPGLFRNAFEPRIQAAALQFPRRLSWAAGR